MGEGVDTEGTETEEDPELVNMNGVFSISGYCSSGEGTHVSAGDWLLSQ